MGRKLRIKKRKKRWKERPFSDEDTSIQIREDYVRVYCLEPLERKAREEPVIERVLTNEMIRDREAMDEDTDIAVRTRERHLPEMPVHSELIAGMQTGQDPIQMRKIEHCLRYYNDAIRWDRQLAKVFLLGLIRQLRYWVMAQQPQPEIAPGEGALEWVRDELIPSMRTDMGVIELYNTPEIDLEYFRRWAVEIDCLDREIQERLFRTDQLRESDTVEETAPMVEEVYEDETISAAELTAWAEEHPDTIAEEMLHARTSSDTVFKLWAKIFSSKGTKEYLRLFDQLQQSSIPEDRLSGVRALLIGALDQRSQRAITELLENGDFRVLQAEMIQTLESSDTPEHRRALDLLNGAYPGQSLAEEILADPAPLSELVVQNSEE
jgi:hypothetical protein